MIFTLVLCLAFICAANAEYGAGCNTTCPEESMMCNDNGKCVCPLGKHFDSTTNQCKDDCESYGLNFQYTNNILYDKNLGKTLIHVDTGNTTSKCECAGLCNSNPQCVFAVYVASNNYCYLLNHTSTNASDWSTYSINFNGLLRSCGTMDYPACQPSQYLLTCHETDITVGPGCADCPDGKITNPNNASSCVCPAGKKQSPGQSGCTECDGNKISAAGDTECTQCASGELAINNHTQCVPLEYLSFKSVSQSGKLKKKKARLAIDGKRKKCAVTDKKTEPYWKGTLQSQSIVAEVQILNIGRGGQYMNVTVFVDDEVCDEYLGPAKQDVNFVCQPAIHGSSITVVRHTPPGRKDKSRLRICEINVKGYPVPTE